ncbi:TetR/AcrR family transcriptional regulator [Kribbella swartbergensis]
MSNTGSARPGGRTARTRAAVFEATVAELAAIGYDQTSVEAIAQRAGVHKTTVYRRWGNKDQLVVEALEAAAEVFIDIPDIGNIEFDLRILARNVRVLLASTVGVAAVRALVSGAQSSPAVEQVLRRFWASRLARVAPIVERAVADGQLPAGTDPLEVMKHLAAPLFHRVLVTAEPVTEADADRAAAAVLAAARAGVFSAR